MNLGHFKQTQKKVRKNLPPKKKEKDVNQILIYGGEFEQKILFDGKTKNLKFSVKTSNRIDSNPIHKYHVKTANGNILSVKTNSQMLAQKAVDSIIGEVGKYRVSSQYIG